MIRTKAPRKRFHPESIFNPNIGTRTGVDVLAGKTVRINEHGFENFDDYFTDIELSSISVPSRQVGHVEASLLAPPEKKTAVDHNAGTSEITPQAKHSTSNIPVPVNGFASVKKRNISVKRKPKRTISKKRNRKSIAKRSPVIVNKVNDENVTVEKHDFTAPVMQTNEIMESAPTKKIEVSSPVKETNGVIEEINPKRRPSPDKKEDQNTPTKICRVNISPIDESVSFENSKVRSSENASRENAYVIKPYDLNLLQNFKNTSQNSPVVNCGFKETAPSRDDHAKNIVLGDKIKQSALISPNSTRKGIPPSKEECVVKITNNIPALLQSKLRSLEAESKAKKPRKGRKTVRKARNRSKQKRNASGRITSDEINQISKENIEKAEAVVVTLDRESSLEDKIPEELNHELPSEKKPVLTEPSSKNVIEEPKLQQKQSKKASVLESVTEESALPEKVNKESSLKKKNVPKSRLHKVTFIDQPPVLEEIDQETVQINEVESGPPELNHLLTNSHLGEASTDCFTKTANNLNTEKVIKGVANKKLVISNECGLKTSPKESDSLPSCNNTLSDPAVKDSRLVSEPVQSRHPQKHHFAGEELAIPSTSGWVPPRGSKKPKTVVVSRDDSDSSDAALNVQLPQQPRKKKSVKSRYIAASRRTNRMKESSKGKQSVTKEVQPTAVEEPKCSASVETVNSETVNLETVNSSVRKSELQPYVKLVKLTEEDLSVHNQTLQKESENNGNVTLENEEKPVTKGSKVTKSTKPKDPTWRSKASQKSLVALPTPKPPTPFVRRSSRTRIPPLAHWRNERIVYSATDMGFEAIGINPGSHDELGSYIAKVEERWYEGRPPPKTRRPRNVQNLSVHHTSKLKALKNEVDSEEQNYTVALRSDLCWMSLDMKKPQPQQSCVVATAIKEDNMSIGLLRIRPSEVKTPSKLVKNSLTFVVTFGKVLFLIDNSTLILGTDDTIFINIGSIYSIENLRNDEAQLVFFTNNTTTEVMDN